MFPPSPGVEDAEEPGGEEGAPGRKQRQERTTDHDKSGNELKSTWRKFHEGECTRPEASSHSSPDVQR